METTMKVFTSEQYGQIRTVLRDGEPWWVLKDICESLEIKNPTDVWRRIRESDRMIINHESSRSDLDSSLSIINEPAMYEVIIRSDKPNAVAFRDWITHEVLPSIRKTGGYVYSGDTKDKFELTMRAFNAAVEAMNRSNEAVDALRKKIDNDAPLVQFAKQIGDNSKHGLLIGNMAKMLQNFGVELGQNQLYSILRHDGYLQRREGDQRNIPTQRTIDNGYMTVHEDVFGIPRIRITGRGQLYFAQIYGIDRQHEPLLITPLEAMSGFAG